MFANASLARRIERAEMGLVLEGAGAAARRLSADQMIVQRFNGGAVVFVEPRAIQQVGGVWINGVPDAETLDRLEQQFADRQAPLQFEVATLADPGVARELTKRGYELVGFENVLALGLTPSSRFEPVAGVEVTRAADSEAAAWLDAVAVGFMHPDTFDGPSSQPQLPREVLDRVFGDTIAAPGFERYIARRPRSDRRRRGVLRLKMASRN